jgi:2-methylcitrate dehydratase PrpD
VIRDDRADRHLMERGTMDTSYTDLIVDFTLNTNFADVPDQAFKVAREAMFDCIGVTLAGAVEPAGRIGAEWARSCAGAAQSTIWGHGFKTAADDAALVNGTAAHALDYDDVTWGLVGHPSVSLVPSLVALGELTGASGKDVLLCYAIGFEVMAKIGRTTQPRHSLDGRWHATSTIGSFGVTAACCRLLGLDAKQTGYALGIAYSMTSGNVSNFGTMTKPFHAGLAARNGIQAAQWARLGFTSVPHPFDGPIKFQEVYSRGLPCDMSPIEELGKEYELITRAVVVKPYPCCVSAHTGIDAAKRVREEEKVHLDDIEKIEIGVVNYTSDKLSYGRPKTGLEGKFSMQYTVARMIQDGKLTLETFTDQAVNDPKIQAFMPKIAMYHDEEAERAWRIGSRPADMHVTLKDGRKINKLVKISKGNKEVPLTSDELRDKFRDCARLCLDDKSVEQAIAQIEDIDNLKKISELARTLSHRREGRRGPSLAKSSGTLELNARAES